MTSSKPDDRANNLLRVAWNIRITHQGKELRPGSDGGGGDYSNPLANDLARLERFQRGSSGYSMLSASRASALTRPADSPMIGRPEIFTWSRPSQTC